MVVSTFVIATVGTLVTEKMIEPRLGVYKDAAEHKEEIHDLNDLERRGLRWALYVVLFLTAITVWGLYPENGFFRGEDGGFLTSPLIKGVVALLFLGAGGCGIAYGFGAKVFKSDADIMKGMGKSMETLAGYYVLVFFAAQFVAYFKWSNLGVIMAIKGAGVLMAAEIGMIPLMILFVLLSALINMLDGLGFGQVGNYGTYFYSNVYADGIFAGIIAGGLSYWRFCNQCNFSYDEFLCTDYCLRSEIR